MKREKKAEWWRRCRTGRWWTIWATHWELQLNQKTSLVSRTRDWRQGWDNFKYINPRFWPREGWEGIYQPCLTLQADWRQFWKTGGRGATYEEASAGYPPCKNAYPTQGQSNYRRKSVIHVWTTDTSLESPAQYRKEYDLKVYGESPEGKLQSAINSVGEQSALLLMVVGDCVINKKSQAEIAENYGIPRSQVQWAMSRKKDHKKGGKQYQQEIKRREKHQRKPL